MVCDVDVDERRKEEEVEAVIYLQKLSHDLSQYIMFLRKCGNGYDCTHDIFLGLKPHCLLGRKHTNFELVKNKSSGF